MSGKAVQTVLGAPPNLNMSQLYHEKLGKYMMFDMFYLFPQL